MYNAQMVRTWSLLLRAAQREGFIVPSRPETSPLSEHTFILHPVEAGEIYVHLTHIYICGTHQSECHDDRFQFDQ